MGNSCRKPKTQNISMSMAVTDEIDSSELMASLIDELKLMINGQNIGQSMLNDLKSNFKDIKTNYEASSGLINDKLCLSLNWGIENKKSESEKYENFVFSLNETLMKFKLTLENIESIMKKQREILNEFKSYPQSDRKEIASLLGLLLIFFEKKHHQSQLDKDRIRNLILELENFIELVTKNGPQLKSNINQ